MFCSLVTIITNGFHPRKFIHENFSMKQISDNPQNFISSKIICPTVHASIHNNLSAGAQNVTGAYVIMLVNRRLLTMRLHDKAAV